MREKIKIKAKSKTARILEVFASSMEDRSTRNLPMISIAKKRFEKKLFSSLNQKSIQITGSIKSARYQPSSKPSETVNALKNFDLLLKHIPADRILTWAGLAGSLFSIIFSGFLSKTNARTACDLQRLQRSAVALLKESRLM